MEDALYAMVCLIAVVQSILAIIMIVCMIFRLKKSKRVCVLVIGDIGRSPRMQNHAISLAEFDFQVDFVGLSGSSPAPEVLQNKNIKIHHLVNCPAKIKGIPHKVFLLIKALFQSISLFYYLIFKVDKCSHMLVQNPPSIPTLAVVWFVCCIKGSSFVIDWHNYGYTILSMNLKSDKALLVNFAKWYEGFFGRKSHANFCVTKAMQNDLRSRWDVSSSVLYDRPVARYRKTSIEEKHKLFMKLAAEHKEAFSCGRQTNNGVEVTAFTVKEPGFPAQLKKDRPFLLISSTSWTEDEDFGILLAALEEYEFRKEMDNTLPKIVCVITGKGPLKDYYVNQINMKKFENVTFVTPWFSAEDYQQMIGAADLGVCLHTSSSGLDLPMKVVDMFSCGVPVCAVGFDCLNELVIDDVNGRVFHTYAELAQQFEDLLRGFPKEHDTLRRYEDNLQPFQNSKWNHQWEAIAKPIFKNQN
ncbi:chitobiosyldiphosphodolichol beta-mannosyltransferase-like [Rhopilema esculentum]|uniref:chitobiosyldiphosphodolichol beta-mannosyltransferase-like n=1 Tax=Rhopilema esculentum TaxID=499914 RepID=UPI0031DB50BC